MKTEQIRLKYIANLSGSPVKEFEGEKEYYSTGAVDGTETAEMVTYKNKPSRANVLVKENDILIAKMKNTNKTTLIDKKMEENIYSTGFAVLKANDKLIDEYLFYLLSCDEFEQLKNINSFGTTQQAINEFNLKNLVLTYVSDKTEQQKIVNKLNKEIPTIELTISETEQDIKDLEEYKKVIITEAVTKGLDSSVSMKDSGIEWIGKMPNNWQIIKIKYLCDMQSGINIVSDNIEESGQFPVYGGNGLRGYYNKYTNNGKHVLIGRQGALAGNVHLVSGKFWASDHAVVTYTYNNITNEYLYYLFIAMNLNQYAFDTAAQPGLAVNKIQNLFTIIPKDDIQQQQIVDYLDKKCAEINELIKEKKALIEDLKLYKKSLIYEYVTGKKEVK